jgi:hypothetical protein
MLPRHSSIGIQKSVHRENWGSQTGLKHVVAPLGVTLAGSFYPDWWIPTTPGISPEGPVLSRFRELACSSSFKQIQLLGPGSASGNKINN